MSETISFPLPLGPNYTIPDVGDENWGQEVTNFLVALPDGVMPTQGTFTLTGDVNLGSTYGLVAAHFISGGMNPALSGFLRLDKTDTLAWRNNANTADLPLGINGSDLLTFNGVTMGFSGGVGVGTQYQLAYYAANGNSVSGLTLITGSNALQSDANGLPVASSTTATELGYVHGVTSAIQTQLNAISTVANAALPETGGTMSGNIAMGGNSITGMANGVNPQDAATVSQLPTTFTITGEIRMWPTGSAPSGWLFCDGTSYLRATYPSLFAVIGTSFGSADGTHFNVPNFTNNVPIGPGSIAALAATAGASTADHTHTIGSDGTHVHRLPIFENAGDSSFGWQRPSQSVYGIEVVSFSNLAWEASGGTNVGQTADKVCDSDIAGVHTHSGTTGSTGSSTIQPVLGINFIIKT